MQPAQHPALQESVRTLAPEAWDTDVPRADIDAAAWWAQFHDPRSTG